MREEIGRALRQADQVEQLQHALGAPRPASTVSLVISGSAMMALTRMRGLSEAYGILEHRLHGLAVVPAAGRVQPVEVAALEEDAAAGRLLQPQHELGRRGLAAAGFAHHAQRLAAFDREGDAVDRAHHAALAAEDAAPRREVLGQPGGLAGRRSCHGSLIDAALASASRRGQPAARRAAVVDGEFRRRLVAAAVERLGAARREGAARRQRRRGRAAGRRWR